jgi:hypothetical protein
MIKARSLGSLAGGFLLAIGLMACGGTAESGFDAGRKDGGGSGGDATMSGKDSSVPILVMDTGGGGEAGACSGIACNVQSCGGGTETTVSGYTYAPNGQLPLYDVQIFIPNAPLDPFAKGVQCDNCGAPLSGKPITTALSDPTGHFVLVGVPTGDTVPIVVQLGKWRRQTSIKVTGCVDNVLSDPNLTRLPKNQMEGSMPHIALTTGECDQMGCMLTKLGIDDAEFGFEMDGYNKAINIYNGNGGYGGYSTGVPGATAAMDLWGSATNLATYDEAIFSCECSESLASKGGSITAAPFGVVTDYLNAGGRIFTTDFQYTWYKYSPDPKIGGTGGSAAIGLGNIAGGAPVPEPYSGPGSQPPMVLSTTIPKSVALAAWLKNVFSGVPLPSGATYPLDSPSQMGDVAPDVIFCNVQSLDSTETTLWASSDQTAGGCTGASPGPRIFTVDTPVGVASDKQCGRGLHIDAHIDNDGQTVAAGYPATGCTATLKADEAAFAFFFFDLSSCISNEKVPPAPPPPVK